MPISEALMEQIKEATVDIFTEWSMKTTQAQKDVGLAYLNEYRNNPEPKRLEIQECFDAADLDDDGLLDKDEYRVFA